MSTEFDWSEIRKWRKEKGFSRNEVADICKVSPSTVFNWESGRNQPHGAAAEPLKEFMTGKAAAVPLSILEDRLLKDLQKRYGLASREELLKELVLKSITQDETLTQRSTLEPSED